MVRADENGDVSVGTEPEHFRKMFIGGLTISTSDEALKEFYSQWGELLDCIVMRDPTTKRSRGFGFVTYSKQSEVDAAMASRPHVIDGKTVDPKRAVPRELSQKSEANMSSKRLYVSGVREEHTQEVFNEYFSKYGTVVKIDIIADKTTGKPRGFAFVTFDDYDSVDKCVLVKSHNIGNSRCDVKKALSKDEMARAQQRESERMDRGMRTRGPQMGGGRGGGRGGGWSDSGSGGGWGGSMRGRTEQGGYGGGAGAGQWGGSGGGYSSGYGTGGGGYGGGEGASRSGGTRGGWSGSSGSQGGPRGWTSGSQSSQALGGWGGSQGGVDALGVSGGWSGQGGGQAVPPVTSGWNSEAGSQGGGSWGGGSGGAMGGAQSAWNRSIGNSRGGGY